VHLVNTFFKQLDFRRFQVNLNESYPMDDPDKIPELTDYGDQLGEMILSDQMDQAMDIQPNKALDPDL